MTVSPLTIIRDIVGPPAGQRILDAGCGDGALVKELAEAGYRAEGVEPGAEAIARARRLSPHLTFHHVGAERLPLADFSFDAVVMVNALHHVPRPSMALALAEARRVLQPRGALVVIEPGVTGSFFEALRPIEDETEVRNAAQAALDEASASGAWGTGQPFAYEREESFATAGAFIARVVAVDPARRAVVERNRAAVLAALTRHAEATADGGFRLVQPVTVRVLIRKP